MAEVIPKQSYIFEPIKEGFKVCPINEERSIVYVVARKYDVVLSKECDKVIHGYKPSALYSIFNDVVDDIWSKGKKPVYPQQPPGKKFPSFKMRAWAIKKTGQAIFKRFKEQWEKHIIPKFDNDYLAMDKKLFCCMGRKHVSELIPYLHKVKEHEYFLKDVLKFRAAAIVFERFSSFAPVNTICSSPRKSSWSSYLGDYNPTPTIGQLEELRKWAGIDFPFKEKEEDSTKESPFLLNEAQKVGHLESPWIQRLVDEQDTSPFLREFIEKKLDWKALFATNGEPYTSLNKTLMNLPPGVPCNILGMLRHIKLERPIYKKAELVLVCLKQSGFPYMQDEDHGGNGIDTRFTKLLQHSTNKEIKIAFKKIWPNEKKTLRSAKDLQGLRTYLYDGARMNAQNLNARQGADGRRIGPPDDWKPPRTFRSLVNLAFEVHEQEDRKRREDQQRWLEEEARKHKEIADPATLVVKPPIELPSSENIKFLATVGEIRQEAVTMGHCIASYALDAFKGNYFLFHVDYKDLQASIQLDCMGRVVQAYGPKNQVNIASKWGATKLKQWGKKLEEYMSKKSPNKAKEVGLNNAVILEDEDDEFLAEFQAM